MRRFILSGLLWLAGLSFFVGQPIATTMAQSGNCVVLTATNGPGGPGPATAQD